MEVIKALENDKTATLELTKSTGDNLVFHTSHNIIKTNMVYISWLVLGLPPIKITLMSLIINSPS
jgi:hypothetical protein